MHAHSRTHGLRSISRLALTGLGRQLLVPLLAVTAGCQTVGWDGAVSSVGTVREVNMLGDTRGRVKLVDAGLAANTIGVGALTGLAGEITIAEGATWITRKDANGELRTTRGMALDDEATMLFTAQIDEWIELQIEGELPLSGLPRWAGFTATEWATVPFIVKGRLVQLDAHVVHGICARAATFPAGMEPARVHAAQSFGTVVGFWARSGAGVITHPGEDIHAHVIVNGEPAYTAHVDNVRIAAGATVLVPRVLERSNKQFNFGHKQDQ